MSDFHQRGLITTLPRLRTRSVEDLEEKLCHFARERPVGLILPCTLDDFRRPAMQEILRQVREAKYFSHIVVSINQARQSEMSEVRHSLQSQDDERIFVIWNDDPELLALFPQPLSGKGFNLWTAVGFLAGEKHCRVVIAHDTDILNYTRELPALLALPLVDPDLDYQFVKGYYPRLSERSGQLFGRVTRLFIGPLLRALVQVEGHHPLLDFLDSFRYPLAGEFGGRLELMTKLTMPGGWDLEMDILCFVHRTLAPEAIAQVDLGINYEHKHQLQTPGRPDAGLTKLASEIFSCLMRNLASEGIRITGGFQKALQAAYFKNARETIRRYSHVASFNQLEFSQEDEMALVDEFVQLIIMPLNNPRPRLVAWEENMRTRPDWCDAFSGLINSANSG